MTATFEYDPVWSDSKKNFTLDFVKRILSAKHAADKNFENYVDRLGQQNKGNYLYFLYTCFIDKP